MPLFGAHMSIAGDCYKSLLIAQEHHCDTVQLFTKTFPNWKRQEPIESGPCEGCRSSVRLTLVQKKKLIEGSRQIGLLDLDKDAAVDD